LKAKELFVSAVRGYFCSLKANDVVCSEDIVTTQTQKTAHVGILKHDFPTFLFPLFLQQSYPFVHVRIFAHAFI
jgi:hypothetical protein